MAVLTAGACTFAVVGKENFLDRAHSRTQEFPVAYQSLYKCFVDRWPGGGGGGLFRGAGPRTALYPDLKFAEYKHGDRTGWFTLFEFRGVAPAVTEVRAYELRESWLDDRWTTVTDCSGRLSAHAAPPSHR